MKTVLVLACILSTNCFGQSVDSDIAKPNTEKDKSFELCVSYGVGTGTIPEKKIGTYHVPVFQKQYLTSIYQIAIGTKISRSFSVGLRGAFQSLKYGYEQYNTTSPYSTTKKWVDSKFGEPTSTLGIYCTYTRHYGIFAPYVSVIPSVVLSSIQYSYFSGGPNPRTNLVGFSYGCAIGVRLHLSKSFILYPEINASGMTFNGSNGGYKITQSSGGIGLGYFF